MGKQYFWGYFSYVLLGRKLENLFCFSLETLKIGQNDPKIPNLEFENHGFLENQVFLPTEQAGTNICWMIYQDKNFKICLSLFSWKENILHKQHIVQWGALSTKVTFYKKQNWSSPKSHVSTTTSNDWQALPLLPIWFNMQIYDFFGHQGLPIQTQFYECLPENRSTNLKNNLNA